MNNNRLFNMWNNEHSKRNPLADYVYPLFCQRAKGLPLSVANNILV